MKVKNQPYFATIIIGLLIALVGYWIENFTSMSTDWNWTNVGLWISETAGFFMLLMHGTFIRSKFFRYLKLVFPIMLISLVFKLMHWPFADVLVITGLLGLILVYFLSFLSKPVKKRLDYLKLAWVLIVYFIGYLNYKHLIGDEYHILGSVFMWLAIIDYFKTKP